MDIKTFHRLGFLFDFNASALTDLIYSLYSTMKEIKGESKGEDVNVYIRLYVCKRVCMCIYIQVGLRMIKGHMLLVS